MKLAIHTIRRGGRRIAVAGANPYGPKGGTCGIAVDGIVVGEGRAVGEHAGSPIAPEDAHAIATALGRPVGTADKFALELIRRGNTLEIGIAIASGELVKRSTKLSVARPVVAQPVAARTDQAIDADALRAWCAQIDAAADAVRFDGQDYSVERTPAGSIRIAPEFTAALRAAGCTGQILGHVYSFAQKRAGAHLNG
jgi:hypothetical protein